MLQEKTVERIELIIRALLYPYIVVLKKKLSENSL